MPYEPRLPWQSPATSPFFSTYILGGDSPTTPLGIIHRSDKHTGYLGRDPSAMIALGGEPVAGLPTPPMDDLSQEGLDRNRSTAMIRTAKNKRRVQNREAQRRFRTRKDQLHKTLQQKTDDLRTESQALRDQHAKSTAEVSRLLMENEALRSEAKDHRQQQRLMTTVLQLLLRGSQSPSKAVEDAGFFDVRSCWADLSQSKKGQEDQFIFVGGPALTDKKGPVRSKLLQQAHRKKKLQQRHDAAVELEALKKGERNTQCTCSDEPSLLVPQSYLEPRNTGYQAIKPKAPESGRLGQGQLCSFCGKPQPRHTQAPATQVWDIGSGSFDPMIPIDDTTSRLRVQDILNFASTAIWPNFRPLGYTSKCYQLWTFPFDDKVKLYAVLWSTAYHQDVLRLTYGSPGHRVGSKEQFRLKGLALECLRKEVSTHTGAKPIDSIIMCILFLAVNDTHGTRLYRDKSPFNPPFCRLHALHIYGSRDYHALHWTIIQDLLGRWGGVEALQTFALAWLLSLSDIMNAAHTLQKPIYPCLGVDGKKLVMEPPLLLFAPYGFHLAQDTAGSGFDELLFMDPPVQRKLVTTFSHIGQLSCVLQYYSRNPCSEEALDLLGDSRNYVHHSLFSTPDENASTEQILQCTGQSAEAIELSRELYLACRLALYLHATHVTFPIPRSTLVRGPLLQLLCPKIQSLADRGVSGPLLLWCASVALITTDMASAGQMLALFKKLCRDLKLEGLDDLLVLLRTFAWVDTAVEHHYEKIRMCNATKLW
ncbi:hypothetical protein BKA56DRAFT_538382 [Ilyonectria sp. MPI-CAGE-AT-0026]|nr:hypothetical protein BKA56DRAFT_565312 [Ilyonectria sp. MPI-CAGE-AT-0026]KAH6999256.1 hypothetical protein BKA56DRAFT_538382 [Ilyonectria sp. MPI-CAGE-AT-0026]